MFSIGLEISPEKSSSGKLQFRIVGEGFPGEFATCIFLYTDLHPTRLVRRKIRRPRPIES
jgi:hypothetical protein